MTLRGVILAAPEIGTSSGICTPAPCRTFPSNADLTGTGGAISGPAYHAGGRLELVGRSPVFLNLVRIYGGGGVDLFSAFGNGVSHQAVVSGGGEFGFEFFLQRRFSFYLEVGGHGGIDSGLPGGETVVAGMNLYPFSK
jgi:hypothetical protein